MKTTCQARELPLAEACQLMGCTRQTFVKWATVGYAGQRLEAYQRGRRWYVTREAIERFRFVPEQPQAEAKSRRTSIDYRKALSKHFG